MTKSRGINKPRTVWSQDQLSRLIEAYPSTNTEILAAELGLPALVVYGKAYRMGLKKTYEYRLIHAGCFKPGHRPSPKTEFKKGLAPWNKGKKGLMIGGIETQFKKGHKPQNYMPIGTEMIDGEGYLKRKVSDTGTQVQRWRYVHVLNWEAMNGPIPKGYILAFIDGNKQNVAIENLQLISRAENMKRNSLHNYPPEIARLIQLRGAINRKINNMERNNHE